MCKSVLVIDTPEICGNCSLLYYCHQHNTIIPYDSKPDSCPLKKLPEHELVWCDDNDWEQGFNACLDTILGE